MTNIKLNIKYCSLMMLMMASGSVFAAGPASSNYAIPWDVLDGGGGALSSPNYAMSNSVAQVTAGESISANYVMQAGFHSVPDSDIDAVKDFMDNCTMVINTDQRDSDADGYGNMCDGDLNNDGRTNTLDLNLYKLAHRTRLGDANYNPDADFNGDGRINTLDLNIYKKLHRKLPGPSALAP